MKHFSTLLLVLACCNITNGQGTTYLFVGTYTDNQPGKGIYVYSMDPQTGALTPVSTGENLTNPSFLNISPNGKYLYACTDTKTLVAGSITSFAIDSIKGQINFINKQSSEGANPVYLVVDKTNTFIINGNYTEGNVSVFTINNDGSVNPSLQSIRFTGSSINKARQEKSHIHSVFFSPGDEYVYLPDLGSDKIRAFRFNPHQPKPLTAMDDLTIHTVPGSGPRHMAFHPNNKFAYCIEEMGGMVLAFACRHGKLTLLQTIPSNSKKVAEYSSADIHISPDGLFLYTSNRGENTLAIFSIAADGTLKCIGHQPALGDGPRNFTFDPTGHFLLVANQLANTVVVFKRDIKTGLLKETGVPITVPSPSCLQMRTYRN